MTIKEMREIAVNNGLFTKEEVESVKKGELRKLLEDKNLYESIVREVLEEEELEEELFLLSEDSELLDNEDMDLEDYLEEEEVEEVEDVHIPNRTDVDWEAFILSQFEPHELDNGFPKINGIRRLTEKYVGRVVDSGPVTVFPSNSEESYGRATVVYEVKIIPHVLTGPVCFTDEELKGGIPVRTISFRGVGTAWQGNVEKDSIYLNFMETIAETRAESRAMKKALGINIVSSEEKSKYQNIEDFGRSEAVSLEDEMESEMAGDSVRRAIKMMCSQMSIDPEKLVESINDKNPGFNSDSVVGLSAQDAKIVWNQLQKYQSKTDSSEEIPEEIKKGYMSE